MPFRPAALRTVFLLACTLALCAGSSPATAQWMPITEKVGVGQSLTATQTTAFVGDPENTYTPGRIFVYASDNEDGSAPTVLEAADGTPDDRFGSALDADGETLVVGAPAANAAYVFRQSESGANWSQVARVAPGDAASAFGRSVAVAGDRIFVAAQREEDVGVVHVYEEQSDGTWQETTVLRDSALDSDSDFGAALLARDSHLVVGAPQHASGAVTIYRSGETGWTKQQTVTGDNLADDARFGTALQWMDDQLLVGAPGAHSATGAVYLLSPSNEQWAITNRLLPFDGTSNDAFGTALAVHDGTIWVGAPGVDREAGALYRFHLQDGTWTGARRVDSPAPERGDRLGVTLAARGPTLVTGLPGDNYGAGTLALYTPADQSWTDDSPISPPEPSVFRAVTGNEIPCSDGTVREFSCEGVDLKAFLPMQSVGAEGGVELSDIWGWTDPQTGTEYALVGRADGTAFVDVSTPTNPVYVGELLGTEGSRVNSWRDVKVYKDHAFIVADNVGDHGMQVFDLTQLRDVDPAEMPVTFEATAHYDRINSAHNVAINKDTGYAYIVGGSGGGQSCGGALHMVNIQDPTRPTFEGCFSENTQTGAGGTGATHDAQCLLYEGPDSEYRGREICVGFNETAISVVDVTDKDNPTSIATVSYPNYGYVHQGWFTDDQRYMYSNDETDEMQDNINRTRTIVWDMSDLDNPTVANQLLLSEPSSDHNLYVKGDRMYQSNYKSGLRVLDISNPVQPKEVGHFDPFPPSSSPGFEGTWSNYPYFESGIIVTSTYEGGLFILEPSKPEL